MYEIFEQLLQKYEISAYRVSKATGVSQATLSDWKRGVSTPKIDKLQKIAEFFGVSVDYLQGHEEKPRAAVKIPVLGRVQAGIPLEAIEEILDYEEITPQMAATGEFFALKVRGQSMEPRIMEGDVIIVRKQETAETGEVVVVLVNGDEATVKRLRHSPEGISLIPNNPAFDVLFFTNREVEELPVCIIGKMVELRGKSHF